MSVESRAGIWAALAVFIFAAFQLMTVEKNYGGNWTGLFCTGDRLPRPASLAAGTYIFHNSSGYDGQMYRYVAHDPFMRGEAHGYLDDKVLRTRRILLPGLAWLFALGRQPWIDATYIAITWLSVFAGTFWTARFLQAHDLPASRGIAFLFVPATLISMDRLVVDVATCALTAGLVWYSMSRDPKKLYAVAAAACLSRETGVFLALACVIGPLITKQWKRAWLFSTALLPVICWYAFVNVHFQTPQNVGGIPWMGGHRVHFGPLGKLFHPASYPLPSPLLQIVQAADDIALVGMLLGFILALTLFLRAPKQIPSLATLMFVVSLIAVSSGRFWGNAYGYSRPFSPMLLFVAFEAVRRRSAWVWLLPCLLIDLRVFMQLAPEAIGRTY